MKLPHGNKTVRAALLCIGCDIPAGKCVDLKDLERPEDVTDVLRNSKERGSTNHMRILTGDIGQSVLIMNTESKLKRSEKHSWSTRRA